MPVGSPVPGTGLRFQPGQVWDSAGSQALPGYQAELNLGWIEPTAVFGSVMNLETIPKYLLRAGQDDRLGIFGSGY